LYILLCHCLKIFENNFIFYLYIIMRVATRISSFILSLVVGSMVFQQQSHADIISPVSIISSPLVLVICVIVLIIGTGVVVASAFVLNKMIKKNKKTKKK
ncbi:MAG: hypothetical protein WCI04_07030, partial [archaeon]